MPLRLDIKKKLSARSDRVKCVDTHPTEPWTLSSLYSGNCFIWDHENQSLVKQFEVCSLPVRCAKFIVRKQWIVTASDDMNMCVFNYNTLEKLHCIEAHSDYIRYLTVHPTQSYVLSSSDDMTIKLWDWDKNWTVSQTFEGHAHYVMMCQWNPKDAHIFASASLDRTIKVWGVGGASGSSSAHFSLTGHTRGVNCLDYSPSGEKPYIVSGGDDKTVRVWDYQTKQCLQTLSGHTNNVTSTVFHPVLPVILSGSEDGSVRVWHSATYRLEVTLNYLLERAWCIHCMKGSINASIGYDEGTVVIKMGSDEPIASMTSGGKIVWAKANEIQTTNVKLLDEEIPDGERLQLSVKDMGNSEIFPQAITHHPNGRLFSVCGDGEYVIYTAQALRNKVFGQALELVWSWEGHYAIRDHNGIVKVFQNFKEAFSFKPPFAVEKMYGGRLLGIVATDYIIFYHWEEFKLIRRIDITPKALYWSENGENVVITSSDSFFLLGHDPRALSEAMASAQQPPDVEEEGYEDAFHVKHESQSTEKITSGTWVGDDCFVFITAAQRINYLSAGQIELVAHLDRPMFILGYIQEMSRLFVIDRENSVVSYALNMNLIEYQSAIVRKDMEGAAHFFAKLPESLHNRVARFLEHQQYLAEALEISKDSDHKFELSLQLGKLALASDILQQSITLEGEVTLSTSSRTKWKQLGDVALEQGDFDLALDCFARGEDFNSLFLLQISAGDVTGLIRTAETSIKEKKYNIAVMCYLLVQEPRKALDVFLTAARYPEAAFFARTYCPSQLSRVVKYWKEDLKTVNEQIAEIIASPSEHPNLFPGIEQTLKAEEIFQKKQITVVSASKYMSVKEQLNFDVIDQISEMGPNGFEHFWLNLGDVNEEPEVSHTAPVTVSNGIRSHNSNGTSESIRGEMRRSENPEDAHVEVIRIDTQESIEPDDVDPEEALI